VEKIAYIEAFSTPVLFAYPPSQIAIKLACPLFFYTLLILPFKLFAQMVFVEMIFILIIHFGIIALFLLMIHRRFPLKISFEGGLVAFTLLFGSVKRIPYEDIAAILETPQLTVFSMKSSLKLIFLPRQTTREKDFDKALEIIQNTLQTRS